MGSGSTILGIALIFIFGIAGIYGLAMGLIHGIFPLWDTVYTALWVGAEPKANWLYYTFAQACAGVCARSFVDGIVYMRSNDWRHTGTRP